MRAHNTLSLSRERKASLLEFERGAGIRFKDKNLLNLALTHRSYSNEESSHPHNNERLEFLGDSVLGMVVAAHIFETLPSRPEGELARIKSIVVSEDSLSGISRNLCVDRYILIGKGEEHSGGRQKKALLADALEAIIGAHYMDSGFKAAQAFVLGLLVPEVDKVLANKHKKDYKTLLQEYMQKNYKSYPHYEVVKKTGPDHDRTFWITVSVHESEYGPSQGKNKKEAEQNAAMLAFESILASGGPESDKLRALEED
jgi:ribonuclease III